MQCKKMAYLFVFFFHWLVILCLRFSIFFICHKNNIKWGTGKIGYYTRSKIVGFSCNKKEMQMPIHLTLLSPFLYPNYEQKGWGQTTCYRFFLILKLFHLVEVSCYDIKSFFRGYFLHKNLIYFFVGLVACIKSGRYCIFLWRCLRRYLGNPRKKKS